MSKDSTPEQLAQVIEEIRQAGLRPDVSKGENTTVVGLVGNEDQVDLARLSTLPGVKDAVRIQTPYKLISSEYMKKSGETDIPRVITVGDVKIGGDEPVIIAGPCAVESKAQMFKIAETVKMAGAHILRGGVFKPRSSVHSFQGIGAEGQDRAEEALDWLKRAGEKYEMPVITEIRGEAQVNLIAEYVDILQIGSRNMYNQDLLGKAARKGKPVLLKRHFGAGIEEFLSFAEYIAAENNKDIILCERGILPVGKGKNYTRYTMDLGAVPAIQKETYLPVIVDPSHGTGRRDLIYNMSCASIAAGACGLMIEAHYNPQEAVVDAQQAVTPEELKRIIESCREISKLVRAGKK